MTIGDEVAKGKKQKPKQDASKTRKTSSSTRLQGIDVLQRISEAVPAVLIGVLVLFQGGFYAGATCVVTLIGVVLLIVFALFRKNAGLVPTGKGDGSSEAARAPIVSLFLFAIALLFLISSLVHGATVTMLLETSTWFAVAGLSLWCLRETPQARAHMLDDMAVVGTVLSAIGILMFVGLLPVEGSVNAGRLMFSFQYANTAGLFFGVVAILCMCSSRRTYRFMAAAPIVALAMTQSTGAFAVFLVALIAVGLRYVHTERPDKRLVAGVLVAGLAMCVGAAVLLQGRLAQAAQTFIERIVQMLDALTLLAGNPVLGVGPDCWQFSYPAIQSAQYRAADVHCSYLQMALDGGVLAAVVFIALIAIGVWQLVRSREVPAAVCVLMMAVHAIFDFDFQFSAMVMLLALLVSGSNRASTDEDAARFPRFVVPSRMRVVMCWVIAVCALAGCAGGVYLDMRVGEVQNACARGQSDEMVSLLESTSLFSSDPSLREQVCGALFAMGDFDSALSESEGYEHTLGSIGLYRAVSLNELGKHDEALAAFLQLLEDFPYDTDLYEAVRVYGEERDLGVEFADAYNAQAARANELYISGHAAWLANQDPVDFIEQ